MRAEICKDGIKRINTKIVVPMDINDVASYIISAMVTNHLSLDHVTSLNKRELLSVAKEEIRLNGTVRPLTNHINEVSEQQVRDFVYVMFPELQ